MTNEQDWNQFRESFAYKLAIRGSWLYLPLTGHLATWLGLATRLNSLEFFSIDVQAYVGMASVPLLVFPALAAAGLVNLLDWKLPKGCQVYASLLIVFLIAMIAGGLFVGPLLDF